VGLALLALAACGAEMDDRPARWSYIYPAIIVPNCATSGCHSALTQTAGINFSDKELARGAANGYLNGGALLRGTATKADGSQEYRMPPDQPLPDADIELIDRWFAAGEPD
jgi:hypothetical protein